MTLMLVLPPAVVVLHLIIALLHRRGDRIKQLLVAIGLIALAYPLQFLGVVLGLGDYLSLAPLISFLLFAPPIVSVLSFLVYVPLIFRGQNEDAPN